MTEASAPPVEDDERAQKQKKVIELTSEGKKLLIAGNKDAAIDKLSDATALGVSIYGDLGVELFDVYLQYGLAQMECASEMMILLAEKKDKDETEANESQQDEDPANDEKGSADQSTENVVEKPAEEQKGDESESTTAEPDAEKPNEPKTSVDPAPEAMEVEKTPNTESEDTPIDPDSSKADEDVAISDNDEDDQPQDGFLDMVKGAWEILELARKIADEQIAKELSAEESKKWKCRRGDAGIHISNVLCLDEEYDRALEELKTALDFKQEVLEEYEREIAEIFFQLGRVNNYNQNYTASADAYKRATEVFKKRIGTLRENADQPFLAHLESLPESSNAGASKEISELEDLCREVDALIQDAMESEKLNESVRKQLREKLLESAQPQSSASSETVNDITSQLRKRKRSEHDESGDAEEKKQKLEEEK